MATILRTQIADKVAQEALVRASGLDWTVLRPIGRSDKTEGAAWRVDASHVRKTQVSRAGVAAALVALATQDWHVGKAMIVSGKESTCTQYLHLFCYNLVQTMLSTIRGIEMYRAARACMFLGVFAVAAHAGATTVAYTDQAAFQTALGGSFTLVNLDAAPLSAFTPAYRLDDTGPAAALATLGLDSVGFNAQTQAGINAFTLLDRNRWILNGVGFGGDIAFNFTTPVNGVGAYSNFIDYGRVRLFSESNLGGTFLGETQFGAGGSGGFGGITSTIAARSAQITCDFNQDLRCGVYDIQFGSFAVTGGPGATVPEPGSWALLIAGFGLVGASLRRARRRGAPVHA